MLLAGPVLHEYVGRAYCVPSLMLALARRNIRDENFLVFNTTNASNKVRFLLVNRIGSVRLHLLRGWSAWPVRGRRPLCTLDRTRSVGTACGWRCGEGCLVAARGVSKATSVELATHRAASTPPCLLSDAPSPSLS